MSRKLIHKKMEKTILKISVVAALLVMAATATFTSCANSSGDTTQLLAKVDSLQNELKKVGQPIQKGNMVGISTITVELKPNVTIEQVLDFYNTKYAPAAEQYFGWKCFFGKCLRGTECAENKILRIWHFKTEADRDKYFKMAEGGNDLNELGEKAWAQFTPTNDALQQLATTEEEWVDWVIK
jgi:hypothetical protein